jgi:hypothetical protein
MNQEEKVRENRLRRMAARQGLTLEKSRRRDDWAVDFGKYRLVDDRNIVVVGASQHAFELSLDEVETYLTSPRESR